MVIKRAKEEKILREAADISVEILSKLRDSIKEGMTTLDIDIYAGELCKEYGVKPAFKEVEDYHFNTCISIDDVAVHGLPSDYILKRGDLISIDFGIVYKGYMTDHCWTWSVGQPDEKKMKLLESGRRAVENAMEKAVVGNRTGDLGFEMEDEAKSNGFNILKVFVGHGIGKGLHEYPDIPAFGKRGTGELLVDGMVICVECQVVDDTGKVYTDKDGWSARTERGGDSVMFEYMVIVRKDSPVILTDTRDWGMVV
ncbi:MAG: Methionine aminopeptidase [candidate division WS6 bacterium GW2011_GWF1_35_23]|uniref:Methionine aminopeptidase n=1 Tax=candidate division WS6 bacterium GW2011_GWF1_35_23 TaxID=1619097 RepID=A0A0G0CPT2_9BACT|nr:MAG: Methionine aminopeptidase [candidate division WS6 bacterium GW2011_GWF1_35_23]